MKIADFVSVNGHVLETSELDSQTQPAPAGTAPPRPPGPGRRVATGGPPSRRQLLIETGVFVGAAAAIATIVYIALGRVIR